MFSGEQNDQERPSFLDTLTINSTRYYANRFCDIVYNHAGQVAWSSPAINMPGLLKALCSSGRYWHTSRLGSISFFYSSSRRLLLHRSLVTKRGSRGSSLGNFSSCNKWHVPRAFCVSETRTSTTTYNQATRDQFLERFALFFFQFLD
jgi:hypothetical protein